jgi:hypothetical protein
MSANTVRSATNRLISRLFDLSTILVVPVAVVIIIGVTVGGPA